MNFCAFIFKKLHPFIMKFGDFRHLFGSQSYELKSPIISYELDLKINFQLYLRINLLVNG